MALQPTNNYVPHDVEPMLSVFLDSVQSLPPHPDTDSRDTYVSFRITEHYFKPLVEYNLTTPSEKPYASFTVGSGGGERRRTQTMSQSGLGINSAMGSMRRDPIEELQEMTSPTNGGGGDSDSLAATLGDLLKSPTSGLTTGLTTPNARAGYDIATMMARRSSTMNPKHERLLKDETIPMAEVSNAIDDDKKQSKLVHDTLAPAFNEAFVFRGMGIPVRRQSSSSLLNCSAAKLASRKPPSIRGKTEGPGDLPPLPQRHLPTKVDPTFHLEVEVFDNTVLKGAGERIATASVMLDKLYRDERQRIEVPLVLEELALEQIQEVETRKKLQPMNAETEKEAQAAKDAGVVEEDKTPRLVLVCEPSNFGLIRENPSEPVDGAFFKAITEELGDLYSRDMLFKLHELIRKVDADHSEGLGRDELMHLLQELYFTTGTNVPSDDILLRETNYLMTVYDKDINDQLDISELCAMVRASQMSQQLKPRWLAPKKGYTAGNVVVAANTVGCLWDAAAKAIPQPLSYPGYRRPNGAVNDRTRKPKPLPGSTVFEAAVDTNKMYEELGIVTESAAAAAADSAATSLANTMVSEGGASVPVQRSSAFGEKLEYRIIENLELQHCHLAHCHIMNCILVGGTVTGGNIESCEIRDGVDITAPVSFRCNKMSYARLRGAAPANCHVEHSVLVDCPQVMQSTLNNCDVQGCGLAHCQMRRTKMDANVKDQGANLLDMCEMASTVFHRDTLKITPVPTQKEE